MTVEQLRNELKDRKLPISGRKAELVIRLRTNLFDELNRVSFTDVKGPNPLVEWARKSGKLFTPEARQYGFTRYPTGLLLTGVPVRKDTGCKSNCRRMGHGIRRVFPDQMVGPNVGDK